MLPLIIDICLIFSFRSTDWKPRAFVFCYGLLIYSHPLTYTFLEEVQGRTSTISYLSVDQILLDVFALEFTRSLMIEDEKDDRICFKIFSGGFHEGTGSYFRKLILTIITVDANTLTLLKDRGVKPTVCSKILIHLWLYLDRPFVTVHESNSSWRVSHSLYRSALPSIMLLCNVWASMLVDALWKFKDCLDQQLYSFDFLFRYSSTGVVRPTLFVLFRSIPNHDLWPDLIQVCGVSLNQSSCFWAKSYKLALGT